MANPHNASRVIHHRELSSVSEKQCDKRQARRGGSKKNKKKRRRKIKEERYAKDRTRRKSWKVGRETRSVLAGQNAEERRARVRVQLHCAVHPRRACAARPMHVVSTSMSRRDLNFPTLSAPYRTPCLSPRALPRALPPPLLLHAYYLACLPLPASRLPTSSHRRSPRSATMRCARCIYLRAREYR